MSLVLDASVTVAWFAPDERNNTAQAVLEQVAQSGAVVPALWRLEVGNAFMLSSRRKRITAAQRTDALAQLSALPVMVDPDTLTHAWTATLALSDRHGLTLYDACYLELAQRRALPLATLDKDLRQAARALDIALLGI